VAEFLIWQQVPDAAHDARFSAGMQQMEELRAAAGGQSAASGTCSCDLGEWGSALHRTQTSVRKLKQTLNCAARQQGFQLCSLYNMDPSLVTYDKVCRGKAGDITALGRLTRKAKDVRVLGMIAKRGLASQKAVPAESVQDLISGWKDLAPAGRGAGAGAGEEDEVEEIVALERAICRQTVVATVAAIRKRRKKGPSIPREGVKVAQRQKVVMAVDDDTCNNVAALLTAAALGGGLEVDVKEAAAEMLEPQGAAAVSDSCESAHVRLLMCGGREVVDVSSEEALLQALNIVITRGPGELLSLLPTDSAAESAVVSTEELLLAEVEAAANKEEEVDAMVFSAADVRLDESLLKKITASGSTVHVHTVAALRKADGKGLQTVHLATSIGDRLKAGAPLTVSVMLDCTGSMGSEIEGCKEGALELIQQFNALSEVRAVNFSGYWDEIGSPGDPKPVSTGFVDPRPARGAAAITQFVKKKLRCCGGGDEPEDIPAAFELLLSDLDRFCDSVTASKGVVTPSVDFLFLIADAGFRNNELARMKRLSAELARRGIVFVLCPTRFHGRSSQATFQTLRDAFEPGGQLIELSNVGQLSDIAATVTGAIKASLFEAGNVVSVTSSVGGTVDALGQLCRLGADVDELKKIKELTAEKVEEEEPVPVVASKSQFELTARDRTHLQLARLPPICHATVAGVFGGSSLLDMMAMNIARQLIASNLGITDLRAAGGCPAEVIQLVKKRMQNQMGEDSWEDAEPPSSGVA